MAKKRGRGKSLSRQVPQYNLPANVVTVRTVSIIPDKAVISEYGVALEDGALLTMEQIEESVRHQARALEQGFLAFAEDLRYLKKMKRYVKLGYENNHEGWTEYLDKHLGIAYKTAMDYIAIVDAAEKGNVSKEKVEAMGSSKARLLKQVPVEARAELAEFATTPQADGHIPSRDETAMKAQELSGETPVSIRRMAFSWHEEKYLAFRSALESAWEMYMPQDQEKDLSETLFRLAMKWTQMESKTISLREQILFLRSCFPEYEISVRKVENADGVSA